MKSTLITLALATAVAALPQQRSEPPPAFKINNIVAGGSGCPRGSIDVKWTDTAILPIAFGKEFTAAVGPKAEITDARKFCQLTLELEYSTGYSFAVYSAEYAGFAELDAGVTGTVGGRYYFSDQTEQTTSTLTFTGPTKTRFQKVDNVDVDVWSPCDGSTLFNVHASVALTPLAGPGSGVLGIAKESGKLTENLFVKWRKC